MHTIDARFVGSSSLATYKENAIRAAMELFYPRWVINQINKARSEAEVDRALANGRKAM